MLHALCSAAFVVLGKQQIIPVPVFWFLVRKSPMLMDEGKLALSSKKRKFSTHLFR